MYSPLSLGLPGQIHAIGSSASARRGICAAVSSVNDIRREYSGRIAERTGQSGISQSRKLTARQGLLC
jgi:hypothetical protein